MVISNFLHDSSDSTLGADYSIKCKQVDDFGWDESLFSLLNPTKHVVIFTGIKATASGRE